MVSWLFMPLCSLCQKIISHFWNKKPNYYVKLFSYRLFLQSQTKSSSLWHLFSDFIRKMMHLCFLKHFHRGVWDFHGMFVLNPAVDLISNWFTTLLRLNYKKQQPFIYKLMFLHPVKNSVSDRHKKYNAFSKYTAV